MSKHGKYLAVIFVIQIIGILNIMHSAADIREPNMDVLTSMSGKVFHGEEETEFLMAIGEARNSIRAVGLGTSFAIILSLTTCVLALWALIFGNERPKKQMAVDAPTVQKVAVA